ncbi:MAG TPA: hypothetical protein VNV87_15970 [Acidimicrobiales bacterium]|jgi:hypothetical protein|nr:hypothetical protein [Acidimicrobiales bacterium]
MTAIKRGFTAFGKFWWEFLVGDTPELLVATLVIVGSALLLRHHQTAGFILVPLITVVALTLSILRGRDPGARRSRSLDLDDSPDP